MVNGLKTKLGSQYIYCYGCEDILQQEALKGESTYPKYNLLGSKTLGLDVLELHYVMLANHDQNIQSCFRLSQSVFNFQLIEARTNCFSAEFSNLAQARLTYRVLCFALSIKGKTLATFCCCCLCCVYESLVRSRGVCLYTYLGFPISRLMSRVW